MSENGSIFILDYILHIMKMVIKKKVYFQILPSYQAGLSFDLKREPAADIK